MSTYLVVYAECSADHKRHTPETKVHAFSSRDKALNVVARYLQELDLGWFHASDGMLEPYDDYEHEWHRQTMLDREAILDRAPRIAEAIFEMASRCRGTVFPCLNVELSVIKVGPDLKDAEEEDTGELKKVVVWDLYGETTG